MNLQKYLSNFFGGDRSWKNDVKYRNFYDRKTNGPQKWIPKHLTSLLNPIYLEEATNFTKHGISQAESPKCTQKTVVPVAPFPRTASIIRPEMSRNEYLTSAPLCASPALTARGVRIFYNVYHDMALWSICKTISRAESGRQRMLNSKFELLSNTIVASVKRCKPWKDPGKVNQQEVKNGANWANDAVSSSCHFACLEWHMNLGMNPQLSKTN